MANVYLNFIGNLFHQRSKLIVTVYCCNFKSSGIVNMEYLSQSISILDISCLTLDPMRCPIHKVLRNCCKKWLSIHFHSILAKSHFVLSLNKLLWDLDVGIGLRRVVLPFSFPIMSSPNIFSAILISSVLTGLFCVDCIDTNYRLEIINWWCAQGMK